MASPILLPHADDQGSNVDLLRLTQLSSVLGICGFALLCSL